MYRRRLLAAFGTVSVAGCYQTSTPPRRPPTSEFEMTFERSAEGNTATVVRTGGGALSANRFRLTIGATRAYENGEILSGFDDGEESHDEWVETVEQGDRLVLSNGGYLPPWRELTWKVVPKMVHSIVYSQKGHHGRRWN